MSLGIPELLVILAVVIVLFGGKKLPELGKGLGEGIKNFRKGYSESKLIDVTENVVKEPIKQEESQQSKV